MTWRRNGIRSSQHRNIATSQHRNIATSQHRNIATSQHRNIVIAILASTAISFTPSIFAFSFSNWFSSDQSNKPTQVAQADLTNPAVETRLIASKTQNENQNIITHHSKYKHKKHPKKYHHAHSSAQQVQPVATPIVSVTAPLITAQPKNEITLSGGLTISSLSNGNQSVVLNSDPVYGTINTYDTQKTTQVSGMGGVAYSRLFHFKHDLSVTIGPALYYTDMDEVSGIEHPSANHSPDYDTLNYRYSADNVSLMAESKLVYEKYSWQPFIIGGIGPSWNRLSSYAEVPTDPSLSATANPSVFKNNTQAQFAYDVGFGVQRIFYRDPKHAVSYRASLAYRYFNFGSGQLSPAAISSTGQAIQVNALDTNAILFAVAAVF